MDEVRSAGNPKRDVSRGWRPMENESKVADGWRFQTRALSTEGYDGNPLGAQTAALHSAP